MGRNPTGALVVRILAEGETGSGVRRRRQEEERNFQLSLSIGLVEHLGQSANCTGDEAKEPVGLVPWREDSAPLLEPNRIGTGFLARHSVQDIWMIDHSALEIAERDEEERSEVLHGLEDWLQVPMNVLSFVWLLLVIAELVWGISRLLETFGIAIWLIFLAEFVLRLVLAPNKFQFLRGNVITVIALLLPAVRLLRAFRVLRFARAARGLRLVKVVGTANRGMNSLKASLGRRGLGYVLAITVLVGLLGAAGMLAFEPASEVQGGFTSYADALWWTAMLLTSMGSQFWPQTPEGRILCLLLSLYGFAVFGYITASFASFFIGQEAKSDASEVASSSQVAALRAEIRALHKELRSA